MTEQDQRVTLLKNTKLFLDAPDGTRKELGTAESVEVKTKTAFAEADKPGRLTPIRRAAGADYTFTITYFVGTSFFSKIFDEFVETGIMPKFNIVGEMNDPASTSGRRSVLLSGCLIDGEGSFYMGPGKEYAKDTVTGYADKRTILDDFNEFADYY